MIVATNTTPMTSNCIVDSMKRVVAEKHTVFAYDNKVALVYSTQLSGINKHSGKHWYRWETQRSQGLYRTHKGTLVPFSVTLDKKRKRVYPGAYFRNGVFDLLLYPENRWGTVGAKFAEQVYDKFGVSAASDVFPMLGHFGADYADIPKGLYAAMRQSNGKDFTRAVFGKRNMRRDLVKATCAAPDLSVVILAQAFKNLVPIDWIIQFMRNCATEEIFFTTGIRARELRKILLQIDPRSYRHLLKDTGHNMFRYAADISRQYELQEPIYARSFRDLHDRIYDGFHRSYVLKENKPIKLLPLAKSVDGLTVNDLTLVPARETDDLVRWGERMSNCIASYARNAVNGNGIYAAVERNKKVIANLEIDSQGNLKQLLGRFNQKLDDTTRNNIVSALNSKGIITTGDWWGND